MRLTSLGWQTDLMVRRLAGSSITDRGEYIVVRTPVNPTYWWGNFVLFQTPAEPADVDRWMRTFRVEFPSADYLAVGIDGNHPPTIEPAARDRLAGVALVVTTTLTTSELRPPARPNDQADYRRLTTTADWEQLAELHRATDDLPDTRAHREFTLRKLTEARGVTEASPGAYFGAFLAGQLRASLGLLTDGQGLARYQTVQTHPAYRNRGLATTLLYHAGRHGLTDLGADQLVILADPEYHAISIYERLGFVPVGQHLQLQRRP